MIEVNGASPFIDYNTIRTVPYAVIYPIARSSEQKIFITRNSITGNARGGVHISAGDISLTQSLRITVPAPAAVGWE